MKSFKKIGALVIVFTMLMTTISAFACANDYFVGFDQLEGPDGKYAKIYKCPQVKGSVYKKGNAETAEWKLAFYEAEYPHKAIDTLILDGQETGMLKWNGEYAKVNTKLVPEFWESKVPYFVYNRLYSDLTGTYKPTTVLRTDYKTAPVTKEWVNKGFGKYVKTGENTVADYSHVYGLYDEKIDFEWNAIADLYKEYLSEIVAGLDANGNPVYTDAFIKGEAKAAYEIFDHAINNVSWLKLTGPDYATNGEMSFFPFDKIVEGNDPAWYDDLLVSDNQFPVAQTDVDNKYNNVMDHLNQDYEDAHATIEWKVAGYELVAPYRVYEVLCINGVPMDGSEVEIVGYDVKKEEVVDVTPFEEYADEVQIIEKAVEEVGYTTDSHFDYVVRPFDTEAVKTVNEKYDYKVVEDYTKEIVHDRISMKDFQDDQFEMRFVKVTTQPGKTRLPYIWRYNGEVANPTVEWKVAFAEAEAPYEIYEEKFVDGIATGVYRSTGKFANDVPTVSTEMGLPRVLTVALEDTTKRTNFIWALENSPYDYIVADELVTVIVPAELYKGFIGLSTDEIIDYIAKPVNTVYNVEK